MPAAAAAATAAATQRRQTGAAGRKNRARTPPLRRSGPARTGCRIRGLPAGSFAAHGVRPDVRPAVRRCGAAPPAGHLCPLPAPAAVQASQVCLHAVLTPAAKHRPSGNLASVPRPGTGPPIPSGARDGRNLFRSIGRPAGRPEIVRHACSRAARPAADHRPAPPPPAKYDPCRRHPACPPALRPPGLTIS